MGIPMGKALDILEDACAALPHTTRAMFGGHGLFAPNGGMFAGVVTDDRLVLKFVHGTPGHAAFAAEGAEPWVYEGGPKPMTMHEWLLVPDDLYDDPTGLAAWCAKAHAEVPARAKRARKGRSTKDAAGPAKAKAAKKPKAPKKKAPRSPAARKKSAR